MVQLEKYKDSKILQGLLGLILLAGAVWFSGLFAIIANAAALWYFSGKNSNPIIKNLIFLALAAANVLLIIDYSVYLDVISWSIAGMLEIDAYTDNAFNQWMELKHWL